MIGAKLTPESHCCAAAANPSAVAVLVGDGRTHRETAEVPVVSGCAISGVRQPACQLGLRSRTQLATWAVEHRLIAAPGYC